jgi:hypothetical protein
MHYLGVFLSGKSRVLSGISLESHILGPRESTSLTSTKGAQVPARCHVSGAVLTVCVDNLAEKGKLLIVGKCDRLIFAPACRTRFAKLAPCGTSTPSAWQGVLTRHVGGYKIRRSHLATMNIEPLLAVSSTSTDLLACVS